MAGSLGGTDDVSIMNRTLLTPWKPTKAQILAARNTLVLDLVAKDLIVLFAGINPGLYTAAIGRPGNRFWPALHGGGFTPRLFSPFERIPPSRPQIRHHQRRRTRHRPRQ